MEVRAARRYLAHTVERCCRTLSSLEIMNSTYDLRVTVPLPVVGMKLPGLRHPLVRLHTLCGKAMSVRKTPCTGNEKATKMTLSF